jgi:hypothetical protein
MAALAKLLAVCAGTVGGAACVATGVAPIPFDVQGSHGAEPKVERISRRAIDELESSGPRYEPAPPPVEPKPEPKPEPEPQPEPEPEAGEAAPATEAGAVEYAPPVEAPPPPAGSSSASGGGDPAGEFGP